jgi:hypothetical protein
MSLQIIQAKPNPAGKDDNKDQNGSGSGRPEQLFGEWVDVKNIGADAAPFPMMQLRHALFDESCHTTGELELYWIGVNADFLKPGQVLRIHAGRREDAHLMSAEDQAGADWHGYAESDNFILNNRCGDKIVLSWQDAGEQICQDWACYAPYPPEDLILKRSGNLLTFAGAGLSVDQ